MFGAYRKVKALFLCQHLSEYSTYSRKTTTNKVHLEDPQQKHRSALLSGSVASQILLM